MNIDLHEHLMLKSVIGFVNAMVKEKVEERNK